MGEIALFQTTVADAHVLRWLIRDSIASRSHVHIATLLSKAQTPSSGETIGMRCTGR